MRAFLHKPNSSIESRVATQNRLPRPIVYSLTAKLSDAITAASDEILQSRLIIWYGQKTDRDQRTISWTRRSYNTKCDLSTSLDLGTDHPKAINIRTVCQCWYIYKQIRPICSTSKIVFLIAYEKLGIKLTNAD